MEALKTQDPAHIGEYLLVARLGAGGMGQVYLGRSPGGRFVAIKVIRDEITDHPEALARFRREVATVGAVRSAYTASLIDASLDAPPYYLATEYVTGPTLAGAVAARGPFPAATCRSVCAALAEGLAAVHRHGVTHRDLKPQNVILAAQGPQLIDFGIARGVGQTALTEAGYVPGTPGFTSPEVLLRNEVGPAADVFALGATLAYAATGRPPFGQGDPTGVSYRAVHEPIDVEGVEPELAALIGACVAKDPAQRPGLTEVIARCGVRSAIVEDAFYGELAGLAQAVPQAPAGGEPPAGVVPPGPHELPTAGAGGHGGPAYAPTYVPTAASFPAPPVAPPGRRRLAPWAAAVALALVVGAGTVTAYLLLPHGKDGGGHENEAGARPRASGARTSPSGQASPAPGATKASASAKASGATGSQGVPTYIDTSLDLDRTLWDSEKGICNLPPEERATSGFMMSFVDPDHPDETSPDAVLHHKIEIGVRDKWGAEADTPYYVTVTVKPPHDIDPDTGRPTGLGQVNAAIGYAARPVDLHAGAGDDWTTFTYPDDFQSWQGAERTSGAIPLTNDPGDWTVQFHHVASPKEYPSIMCTGFRAK